MDRLYLEAVVEHAVESLGRSPGGLPVDAGHYSDSNVMWLCEHKIAPFMSTTRTRLTARAVTPRGPISVVARLVWPRQTNDKQTLTAI